MSEKLTPCTCTIKVTRTKTLLSTSRRTPTPGCPLHFPKVAA